MAKYSLNGTTVAFASNYISAGKTVEVSCNGNPIDVTELDDSYHTYITGLPDWEVKVTTAGVLNGAGGTVAIGKTGTLGITFPDETVLATISGVTNWIVVDKSFGGSVDDPLEATYTFKPLGA